MLVMALAACGDPSRRQATPATTPPQSRTGADPSVGQTTELDKATTTFGDAVLAEMLGDDASARAGFEAVLASSEVSPQLAARSALHLAQLESRAGKSRDALDLVARATALAPTDPVINDGVVQLEADIVAAAGAGDIRGPRLGTPLAGVAPKVAEAWADAEKSLGKVNRLRLQPVIEALSGSIRIKEAATEDTVSKYRQIAEQGGVAAVAGHYRAGSLYHDLAIGLLFELPPELDPRIAANLRRTLRGRALAYLKKAVAEYRECLGIAAAPDSELWRLAAETDLRRALDALGDKTGRP